ncbi:MAG: OmpH family outer membrane protein [Deltaproteobacteria bacterium]|nr:MAG: OmpH family outer membrane protein [Deltaproteobacteria bacterium]
MSRRLTTAFVLALTAGVVVPPQAGAAAPAKLERVAVVQIQRVLLETKEGKKARKDLEKTFARNKARLDAKRSELEKKIRDLQRKAPMLSEAKLAERQQALMREQADLEQLAMSLQQEIADKEALLTEKIYRKAAKIVEQIALEEKLQIVFVRGEMTVLYADPRLDITNRVILAYDKKHR